MVPCFLNLTLQPAVLSPQRPVASLLPYFAFFKPFSFMYLRTLPSSVSCKSCVCHSYENGRGAYQQFPIWNAPCPSRETRPCRNPSILHFRLCELCVLSRLCVNPGFSSFATVHGSPSTFPYPLSFHILADSFALCKIISPFFSCNSGLFAQNTRGWGGEGSFTKRRKRRRPPDRHRDKFRSPLQGDNQENEGCRRYGAARRGRRKRKKASGLESRQT